MQRSIPYMQYRAGSSKGIYFNADDLPADVTERDRILLDIVGRDERQIDGLGGAHPLTSKVAIVGPSNSAGFDVDYLFAQVVVGENRIDTTPNCGNILAGVGPFAIENNLVSAAQDSTNVRVNMLNSGNQCTVNVQTPNGLVSYQGEAAIDGVPGTSAPVLCHYQNIAGSACGSLLPTDNALDVIDGIGVTCIDNGMPVVMIKAQDLGKHGDESCDELMADQVLRDRLEAIRLQAGLIMQLGDVQHKVIPKMILISTPGHDGCVRTRSFIPHQCHAAIGVLAAVSVATACTLTGSVADGIAKVPSENPKTLSIEHPCGEFSVSLSLAADGEVQSAALLRTARLLSRGEAFFF